MPDIVAWELQSLFSVKSGSPRPLTPKDVCYHRKFFHEGNYPRTEDRIHVAIGNDLDVVNSTKFPGGTTEEQIAFALEQYRYLFHLLPALSVIYFALGTEAWVVQRQNCQKFECQIPLLLPQPGLILRAGLDFIESGIVKTGFGISNEFSEACASVGVKFTHLDYLKAA